MKRFAKFRKYLPLLLCSIGASMAATAVSGLLRYHDASEKYRERVDPIIYRMIQSNPTPQSVDERIDLISDLHSLRFRMDGGPVLVHVEVVIFGGLGLLALGFFLAMKISLKPEAPAPPTHAWDSVPPPSLAKSDHPAPQP